MGYIGVCKSGRKFRASICADYKSHYLGVFETAEEAAKAYQDAKLVYHR